MNYCQLGKLVPLAQLARYVKRMQIGRIGSTGPFGAICLNELVPIGPIGSTGPIGAICPNKLVRIGPIGSIGPIGAICTNYANWANWFHGPNWRAMLYECQLGQLVPRPQLVRNVSTNNCQLGQLVPSAQLARYVLFMPIDPIGSTGSIGAICTMYAKWGNWFHRPIWRDMYYLCQLSQLVPRAQLVRYISMNYCQLGKLVKLAQLARYVQRMQIGRIRSTGPIGAICPNESVPIGPIGSIGPIGAIFPFVANWANWLHRPNWCDMYQ